MLKVAVLSGWHVHADGYAKEFASLADVKLTAMWDEDPERGNKFADKYGMEFVPGLDALLTRGDVDAVSVTTPTDMHPEVLIASANAGKHIFTEKVLALTNQEAKKIKEAVVKSGKEFCISFPHRTFPHNLYAKKIVEEGKLGKITLLRVRNAHGGVSSGWLPPHFLDKKSCGGGAMMDLGAHPMYLIYWLMGRPVEMSSAFTNVYDASVEDNAVSIMKFENGAIAVSETSFVSDASPFSLELYGTEGVLLIGHDGIWLKTKDHDGYVEKDVLPKPLSSPITQFVGGILRGEKIHFGIDDAMGLTEMMDAAYRSYDESRHVKL